MLPLVVGKCIVSEPKQGNNYSICEIIRKCFSGKTDFKRMKERGKTLGLSRGFLGDATMTQRTLKAH